MITLNTMTRNVDFRKPLQTRSGLPAPIFCAAKVASAVARELYGCCTSCSIREVAVNAAMTSEPKRLMMLCSATQENAIRLPCAPNGMPRRRHFFISDGSGRKFSFVSRKYGFFFTA